MSVLETTSASQHHTLADLSPRCFWKRVRDMAILWSVFGAVCGAAPELGRGGNLIGIVSGMIAGIIVTPLLGVVLALFGGQVKMTLLGGLWGAIIGASTGFLGGAVSSSLTLNFGLLVGGMAGGTFPQVLRATACLARSVREFGRGR